jgi:hypothetical protein
MAAVRMQNDDWVADGARRSPARSLLAAFDDVAEVLDR